MEVEGARERGEKSCLTPHSSHLKTSKLSAPVSLGMKASGVTVPEFNLFDATCDSDKETGNARQGKVE